LTLKVRRGQALAASKVRGSVHIAAAELTMRSCSEICSETKSGETVRGATKKIFQFGQVAIYREAKIAEKFIESDQFGSRTRCGEGD
jgi:hypothetical protein